MVSAGLAFFGGFLDRLPEQFHILAKILNLVISFGVITVLFALTSKFVPDVKIAWKDVWLGAAITSGLFTAGKAGIGAYLGHSSMASSYGAAGSLVVLLVWVYYSAQIVFFGAEFTQVYANRLGSRVVPSENAIPATAEARAQEGLPTAASKLDPAVAKYIDGWNRHDALAVIASLDRAAIYRDPSLPAAGIGLTEFLSHVESTLAAFSGLHLEVKSVHTSDGNSFAIELVMHGTPSDRLTLEKDNFESMEIQGCLVFEVAEGKIRAVKAYYDPAAAQVSVLERDATDDAGATAKKT